MRIYTIYFVLNKYGGSDELWKIMCFFKIVCIDDNNVFEYRINEDTNRKTLDEIHEFVKQNINKYPNCKWLLLPCEITK